MKSLTIEQLAEQLGGKLWIKGDMKRIYLDRGYNTKKMSTKTYVYQREDGTFGVSCYIDCPSQHPSWIESQKQEVIDGVESDIEEALADTYYLIIDDSTGGYINDNGKEVALNHIYSSDRFLNQSAAEKYISKELGKGYSVKSLDRDEFEKEVERLDVIEEEKRIQDVINNPQSQPVNIQATVPTVTINTDTPDYGVGVKVIHARFGNEIITAESDKIAVVNFESVGEKQLLKAYAKLEKI